VPGKVKMVPRSLRTNPGWTRKMGVVDAQAQAASMLAMLRRLQSVLAPLSDPVATLRLSARGSWRAELDGGATVEMGRGSEDEVASRAERFVRTLDRVTARFPGAPRALVTADLRHPDGYALRLAGISTAPNTKPQQ